jgi:ABC-type molybdate transport system substrate-binding protein
MTSSALVILLIVVLGVKEATAACAGGNANSGIFPSDNVWRHLAFTFKQNGNMNIYVAGSLQATSATVTSTFATQTMQWGHYVGTRRFDGVMDEIEVYLTELSASQVAALAAK